MMRTLGALIFLLSTNAWSSPAVQGIRQCSGFHSCWAGDCLASVCPVRDGEPVCDMTKIKFPTGRQDPKFIPFKNASRPFFMSARGNAKGTFLLVHGLSDSPYTYGPLAEELAKQGYNSVAILLTGHGADNQFNNTSDKITSDEWVKDLTEGFRYVTQRFKKSPIFLSGFSTGGAVAVRFLMEHKDREKILPGPHQDPNVPLKGMVLYDPALGLSVAPETLIKNKKIMEKVISPNSKEDPSQTVGNNPARIPFDTLNIAPGLGQTIKAIESSKTQIEIPTLAFFTNGSGNDPDSEQATTILTYRARDRLDRIVPKKSLQVRMDFYQQIHNQLLTRDELGACVPRIKRPGHYRNPEFDKLVKMTLEFADKHYADKPEGQQIPGQGQPAVRQNR